MRIVVAEGSQQLSVAVKHLASTIEVDDVQSVSAVHGDRLGKEQLSGPASELPPRLDELYTRHLSRSPRARLKRDTRWSSRPTTKTLPSVSMAAPLGIMN